MVSVFVRLLPQICFILTQHTGLIRWGIVIHGFIDGYSRLITGLRASNNNLADTVLDLFLHAAQVYGIPSCLRGDHGTENLAVAAWIEEYRGVRRGSYIWGR
jgi:transposase InsO family protein